MARIIGGIGTSHVPTIAMAYDRDKRGDPDWAPLFDGYAPVARWLAERRPDVLLVFYNDHATSFFFDHYPTFALGVAEGYALADEGLGPRRLPPLRSHAPLARHLAHELVADEFDISTFQGIPVDHGCHSPLTMLAPPSEGHWPIAVIPFAINVLQHPLPTPLRCWLLGKAVRRAVESFPEDLKIVVAGTGGLSHQLTGDRAGFNNPEWDQRFLEQIADDPLALTRLTHADYARLGGTEGAEVIMWLAMRGALSDQAKKLHQSCYLPMTTAMAVALFEEPRDASSQRREARGVPEQLRGFDALPGSFLFDLERSAGALRLNRFLHGLVEPAQRELFSRDPESAFAAAGLPEDERALVRRRDWRMLVERGASFFTLEKLARVSGVSNPEMIAAIRGESLDDFLSTRRMPGAR